MPEISLSPGSLAATARMLLPVAKNPDFKSLSELMSKLNDKAMAQTDEVIRGAAFDFVSVLQSYRDDIGDNRLTEQDFLRWLATQGFQVTAV